MKLNGKDVEMPSIETVVFHRPSGPVVIKAKPILSYKEFEDRFPRPEHREIVRPGNVKAKDMDDPTYPKRLEEWSTGRYNYMIIKSLEATEGLTWDTINLADMKTYDNYEDELRAQFTEAEYVKIMVAVQTACGLNDDKISLARESFLVLPGQNQELAIT